MLRITFKFGLPYVDQGNMSIPKLFHGFRAFKISYLCIYSLCSFTKADSRFSPSQRKTSLQSNAVSHWLGANLESALFAHRGWGQYLRQVMSLNDHIQRTIVLVMICFKPIITAICKLYNYIRRNIISSPSMHPGPFYQHGLTLILSLLSNYIHYKVWDEITYPSPTFATLTFGDG